jgi:hypothetical protein
MADSHGSWVCGVDQLGRKRYELIPSARSGALRANSIGSVGSAASQFHRLSRAHLGSIGSARARVKARGWACAASVPRGSVRGLVGAIGLVG